MPDKISRKRHKKKVLDRWENEGGALPPAQIKTIADAAPEERPSAGGEPQPKDKPAKRKTRNPPG